VDEFIYRAMLEENGHPRAGQTATTLGIRKGYDIEADPAGMVHRPLFSPGGKNGLSCAFAIADLPPFARPIQWGGQHKLTRVWKIQVADLPNEVVAEQDGPHHVLIGPARSMTFHEYSIAIASTATMWIEAK
jgi:hypothetical protein